MPVKLPIKIGDTILMGKFKNKKVVIKKFGTDKNGQPTVNGKNMLTFRIPKLMYKKLSESKVSKVLTEAGVKHTVKSFLPKENLLSGFDISELIDTIDANERVKDEKTVIKVFNELLKDQITDAKHILKKNMSKILEEIKNDEEPSRDLKSSFKIFLDGAKKLVRKRRPDITLDFKEGKKFIKIIEKYGSQKSAWGFVNKENGDIFKAATWNAPAKKARGNIYDKYNGLRSINEYGPHYLR